MLCVKKTRWVVSLVTVTMTLLIAGLCVAQGQADTTDYIAELNKLGIAGRPESDNAAPYYQKAIELYVEQPTPIRNQGVKWIWPKELPAQEQDVLRKWVQDNNAALEQLQLGSQKSYCWFTHTSQKLSTEIPHLRTIKKLAMALQARAMLRAEDGDITNAVNDIMTLYKFGAHIAVGPKHLIEKLVGIAIKSMSTKAAFNVLDKKIVNADLMENLQNQLGQLCPKQNEPFDIRGEKIYMQEQIETDPNSLAFKPYLKNALEYYDTIAAKTPWQLHNEQASYTTMRNPLIETAGSGIPKVVEIEYRNRADTQALITTLALMRYKSDNGGYPAALSELVSAGYIKELPIDPFSNNPFVYKQTRESFTLYSFGADYDDDGGQPSKWGSGEEGGDQVFWPVQLTASAQKQVAERKLPTEPEQEKLTELLHQAVIAGDTNQMQSVISQGADVDGKNRQSWTPLHTALWYGDKDVVELLISKGADVNAQDDRGNSPLHFAAIKGKSDAASLLITKGADVNAKTKAQQTPLHLAADYGHKDIVELLIAKGADINAQTGSDNALSFAKRKRHNEIIELLVKHGAQEPTVLTDEELYRRGGQTEGPGRIPSGGLDLYPDIEEQTQRIRSRTTSRANMVNILPDPNEVKARIKTFEGLEKELQQIERKSRNEKGAWLRRRIDNRTSLVRIVEQQVEQELTFVHDIAVEEKAEKTTNIIDGVLSSRDDVAGKVRKELLEQKRQTRQSQQSVRGRGRSRTSRGTRDRNSQDSQDIAGLYPERGGAMTRTPRTGGRLDEDEELNSENENRIRQWLQAGIDNKDNLLQFVYDETQTQYLSIREVAVEEEAKKTTAAIDGILLSRQERLGDITLRMEEATEKETEQETRGRAGRAFRGRNQQDTSSRGQQSMDETGSRTRRR